MPSLSIAQAHLVNSAVTRNGKWLPLTSGPRKIGSLCGVGIQLYFTFLKYVASAFFVWTCFHLPKLYINFMLSSGSQGFALMRFAPADYGRDVISNIEELSDFSTQQIVASFGILDAAGCAIFALIIGWFCYKDLPGVIQQFDEDNVTPADFAVEISGLPERIPNHETYEAQVTEHVTKTVQIARKERGLVEDPESNSTVVEVCLVRDFHGQLRRFDNLGKLQTQLLYEQDKPPSAKTKRHMKKIKGKMDTLRMKCNMTVAKGEERNVKNRAYVMLNTVKSKELLLDYYRFGKNIVFRRFQKEHLRFHGCGLKVIDAPEPWTILWENQDRVESKVFFRKSITIILSLLLLFLSCLIISFKSGYLQKYKDAMCQEVEKNAMGAQCRCDGGLSSFLSTNCSQWFRIVWLRVLSAMGTVVTVVLNLSLQAVMSHLSKYERPLSYSAYYASLLKKVFIAQFLNTAIVILIANYITVKFPLLGNKIEKSTVDFSRVWYFDVGVSLTITMMVQIFFPHFLQVILHRIRKICRRRRAKKQTTQRGLNELFTLPQFPLAGRLACLLNILFTTMMFSSGLPLLSLTATLTFIFSYFNDRYVVLRCCKKTTVFDQSMFVTIKSIIPFAYVIHAAVAIMMFGHQDVFASGFVPWKDAIHVYSPNAIEQFLNRCLSIAGFPNCVLLVLTAFFFVLRVVQYILGATFGNFFSVIFSFCRKKKQNATLWAEHKTTARKSRQLAAQRRPDMLFTYRINENPAYTHLVSEAYGDNELGEKRLAALETRKSRMPSEAPSQTIIEEMEEEEARATMTPA